jgi:regulator of protease activity HflC (stomatin/prohibitin superfamily)
MLAFISGTVAIVAAVTLFLFGGRISQSAAARRMRSERDFDFEYTANTRRNDLSNAMSDPQVVSRVFPIVILAVGMALIANSLFVEVPAGHRGVVLTFKAASDQTLKPGLGLKLPWQDVVPVTTRAEAWNEKFECQSADLQKMEIEMTLIYRRNVEEVAEVYKRVRMKSGDIDVKPGGRETLKAAVAEFDAAKLIQNRADLASKVNSGMSQWIDPKGLTMVRCSIANINFESSYDERVEAKVIALEKAREAQNELKQQETMAQITKVAASGRKEAAKEQARGENESRQILAEANAYDTEVVSSADAYAKSMIGRAEAERTTWLAKAIGDSRAVLTLEAITKWNGDVPSFSMEGGTNSLPFEFLKSSEVLKEFSSPIAELEAELEKHQIEMAEKAKQRAEVEKEIEIKRMEREAAEAKALNGN